jgi:WD40 repeat protein
VGRATGEVRIVIDAPVGTGSAAAAVPGAFEATFSADDTHVLLTSGTGASLWRNDRGALLEVIATGGELWSAAWSPDEQRIAIAGLGRGGVKTGAGPLVPFPVNDGTWMYDVNWAPDGARLVIAGKPDVARLHRRRCAGLRAHRTRRDREPRIV